MTQEAARNADLRAAVANGDLDASHELAMRLRIGIGDAAQPDAAATLMQMAARRGHAASQLELGLMHASGDGVPEDPEAAAYWIRRAAQHGLPKALYWLATLHFSGLGVPRDLEQAYRLCLSAREAGFSDSGEILAAAAHYIGTDRCAEIAAELGVEPPPIWELEDDD